MNYCEYYQAYIQRDACGYLVSILRSFEHLVFDRTLDKVSSHFEFFVPAGQEVLFLELMAFFEKEGIVTGLEKKPNRLRDPRELV
jgi:hypothetical protein